MRRFKVGDEIKVREDLEGFRYYGDLHFHHEMKSYCGKEYIIQELLNYNTYTFYKLDNSHWEFSADMLLPVEEEKQIQSQNINTTNNITKNQTKIEEIITPQSFESNDGRFCVEVDDDGSLKLTMTNLTSEQDGYYDKDEDWVQKLHFEHDDLERLIDILIKAKEINPYNLKSLREKIKRRKE